MELYKNTTNAFVDYLKRHGYPEDSIVLEWGTRQFAIDIAIVADDHTTPIAIFEIKGRKTHQAIQNGVNQLSRACHMLQLTVPCSLVFGLDHVPFFEVVDVSDVVYNNTAIDFQMIMENQPLTNPVTYKIMQSGLSAKMFIQKQQERQNRIDKLKPVCWIILPIIAIAVILLDALGVYILNGERLAVLGVTAVIILIPFFSEITVKDITLKREKAKGRK